MIKYAFYIRVSTKGQERIGLSFEAQKANIAHYDSPDKADLVQELIEIESGKDVENRPLIKDGIHYAKTYKCILVEAKLDRLPVMWST